VNWQGNNGFADEQVAFVQAAAILKARTYCMQLPQWAYVLEQASIKV
jgi:hypothetical protein